MSDDALMTLPVDLCYMQCYTLEERLYLKPDERVMDAYNHHKDSFFLNCMKFVYNSYKDEFIEDQYVNDKHPKYEDWLKHIDNYWCTNDLLDFEEFIED